MKNQMNINGLNLLVSDWFFFNPTICCLAKKDACKNKDFEWLKVKGWRKKCQKV